MAKMNNNEMEKKLAEYLDERWCIVITLSQKDKR